MLASTQSSGIFARANGFEDVTIECLGLVDGWVPLGTAGKYQVAHADLVRGNEPLKNCAASRHVATSNGPFGVVVWGTDWAASYGYPAGGNLASINELVVEPVVK